MLREFREHGPKARVFNFDDPKQWKRVKKHLEAPEVLAALDLGMQELMEERPRYGPWDAKRGPWSYGWSSYWVEHIEEALCASDWEWKPPEGIALPEPDEDGFVDYEGEAGEAYVAARNFTAQARMVSVRVAGLTTLRPRP